MRQRISGPRPRRDGRAGPTAAALASGTLAAAAARAAYTVLIDRPPGGAGVWTRTNHRGEPVTLLEGPAVTVGAIVASALGGGLPARVRAALVTAGAGAAAFGGYDDLAGSGDRRGFRGHLGALARGEVTTGAVKLAGIGATGLVAAAALGGPPADVAINAGLAAGGANLLNLFDLRPGRAVKVALGSGVLLVAGSPAGPAGGTLAGRSLAGRTVAAPVGAALALLGEDLAERAMLGDAGANALGALLGVAAGASLPRSARVALLALVVGLTAASELVSFTTVIERTPALRRLDMLGRRPAGAGHPAEPVPGAPVPGPPAGPPTAGEPGATADAVSP